jgi:hypothetical protein
LAVSASLSLNFSLKPGFAVPFPALLVFAVFVGWVAIMMLR